ncbi:hypothetical protein L0128_05205, partial [candidate division KSB1 bacterium]|nr:hypothetical protein [candidate division KSB1 bacterium]
LCNLCTSATFAPLQPLHLCVELVPFVPHSSFFFHRNHLVLNSSLSDLPLAPLLLVKMIVWKFTALGYYPENFVNLTKFQVVFFIRENPFDPLNPRSILVAAWLFYEKSRI